MANVLATIRGAITGILEFWRSNWQLIVGAVQTANDQLNGAVRGGMDVLQGLIRGGLSGAVEAARGFTDQFSAVGSALMQGLRSGILGAAGQIAAAAVDVVRRAIDAAKALAGIASPSRVFMEIGSFMGEGLALGMEGSTSRVELAADRMADAAIDTVDRISTAFSSNEFGSNLSAKISTSFDDAANGLSTKDVVGQLRKLNGTADQSSYLAVIISLLQALLAQGAGTGGAALGAQASRRTAELGAF